MKIYQGEELPHPKSMLQVSSHTTSLLSSAACWTVYVTICNTEITSCLQ